MKKNYVLSKIIAGLVIKEEKGTEFKGFTCNDNRELNKKLNEERKIMEVK